MAKRNASDQDYTNNVDGFSLGGGTVLRTLNLAGGDLTFAGAGTAILTFPPLTDTLVTLTSTVTLTNKTLTAPVIAGGTITGITDLAIADGGTGAFTAADALVNLGLTATATELNYTDGVTSAIQTQLNTKVTLPGSPADYTITNSTTDRTFNADQTTIDELADVLATLIADLTATGLLQ